MTRREETATLSKPGRTDQNIPDLLQRDFLTQQPNLVWVTDITEFPKEEGTLYLCMIKDLHDGTVVGWKIKRAARGNSGLPGGMGGCSVPAAG